MDIESSRYMIRHAVAEFIRYCADTISLADVTVYGASALVSIHDQLLALDALEEDSERDASIIRRSEIARLESDRGFPLLHAHALMGAWGALEAAIDDVCVGWLMETDGRALVRSVRLKVPLGEFLSLHDVERWRWVLEQVRRDQNSTLKAGIGQFEVLLDAVGLGGACDEHLRKALFLTKALRNLIAHRGGRVDQRFLEDCPSLDVRDGDQIHLGRDELMAALSAMMVYAESIIIRSVSARGGHRETSLPPWVPSTASLVIDLEGISASVQATSRSGTATVEESRCDLIEGQPRETPQP